MMSRLWQAIVCTLVYCLGVSSFSLKAQNPLRGVLDNGLKYIIHSTGAQSSQVEVRIVFGVGSCMESEEERGLAHFLEHLAFAGSVHFPQDALMKWMGSIGVRYGVELNAYTTHRSTIYTVSLPKSDEVVLTQLMIAVADLIDGLTLSESAIEREKLIVKEEIRSWRQSDPFYDLKIGRGLHAQRMPLGTVEDIDMISQDRVRAFYNKWYRPELTTLIVVGGIDPAEVETAIRGQIGKVVNTKVPPTTDKVGGQLCYPAEARYHHVWDDLITQHKIDYIIPHPTEKSDSYDALYEKALRWMALAAWGHRLLALPGITVTDAWYLGETSHLTISLSASDLADLQAKMAKATAALYSLSAPNAISTEELRELSQQAKERNRQIDTKAPATIADCYIEEASFGDYQLTDSLKEQHFHHLLEQVTVEDLLPYISAYQEWLTSEEALIAHLSPLPEALESRMRATINCAIADGRQCGTYSFMYSGEKAEATQEVETPALFTEALSFDGQAIETRRYFPQIGVTEVCFTNGLQLLLKPTEEHEMVRINVVLPGGQASIPLGMETQLESLAAYMELGLLERVPREELLPYMLQNDLSLSLLPSTYWYELFGSTPSESSGVLVRLIFEKMVHPEVPYADMEEVRAELLAEVGEEKRLSKMVARSPEMALERELSLLLGDHLPLRSAKTVEEIKALDIEVMAEAHKERCSRTLGTTIIVTGGFEIEEMVENVGALFGNLPHREPTLIRQELPDLQKVAPKQVIKSDQENDITHLTTLYTNTYTASLESHLMLKITHELLRTRVINDLRTQKGIAYSPAVYLKYRSYPQAQATFYVEVSTAPHNCALAEKSITTLLHQLMAQPIDGKELEQIKKTFLLNKAKALGDDDPNQWHKTLNEIVKTGESIADFEAYEKVLGKISPHSLQRFHQAFFSNGVQRIFRIEPE